METFANFTVSQCQLTAASICQSNELEQLKNELQKFTKLVVRSQNFKISGMLLLNVLCAWMWQEECRFIGVEVWGAQWTGRRACSRLRSIISREQLSIAVGRCGNAEHCTAVDLALTQLLEHLVSLLYRIYTEHWRNYLQPHHKQPLYFH